MLGRPQLHKVASARGDAKSLQTTPSLSASAHLWSFITPYTCNTTQRKCALKPRVRTAINATKKINCSTALEKKQNFQHSPGMHQTCMHEHY